MSEIYEIRHAKPTNWEGFVGRATKHLCHPGALYCQVVVPEEAEEGHQGQGEETEEDGGDGAGVHHGAGLAQVLLV